MSLNHFDFSTQFADFLQENQSRHVIAESILLPVKEMLGKTFRE